MKSERTNEQDLTGLPLPRLPGRQPGRDRAKDVAAATARQQLTRDHSCGRSRVIDPIRQPQDVICPHGHASPSQSEQSSWVPGGPTTEPRLSKGRNSHSDVTLPILAMPLQAGVFYHTKLSCDYSVTLPDRLASLLQSGQRVNISRT